jgi:copper chaperone NosL
MLDPQSHSATNVASPRRLRWLLWAVLCLLAVAGVAAALWRMGFLNQAVTSAETALDGELCLVAPPSPYDPTSGLATTDARPVPTDARCPVCGMFPARSPDWAAQIIFDDGAAHFFDSPVSLFMYLHNMARYSPGRHVRQVVAQYVTDAGGLPAGADTASPPSRWIDARTAFYVHGSSAKGPMRAGNLPAFATREAAQAFADRRGGVVLNFDGIDPALVARLGGRSHHDHD